jgi:hypothetical protein
VATGVADSRREVGTPQQLLSRPPLARLLNFFVLCGRSLFDLILFDSSPGKN